MPYRLPTPDERKALFACLKQQASLSGWRRLYDFYIRFLGVLRPAFEHTQNHPDPEHGPLISSSDMSRLYRCQAAFEHALRRLKAGDRRCFAWAYRSGHFTEGMRGIEAFQTDYERWMYQGGAYFGACELAEWPQIEAAMNNTFDAWHDVSAVLQERHLDVPAPLDDPDPLFDVNTSTYLCARLLQSGADNLPEVPIVDPPVLVKTGQTVPHDGIWEPCDVQYTPGFHGLFVKPILPADNAQIPIEGCMNYLLAGHPAPTVGFLEDNSRNEGKPTTWRLIWIDDRYGNNPIPAEEEHYDLKPLPADPA